MTRYDKTILVHFWFTVLTAVHLQNVTAKSHKLGYKRYSGQAENIYISVRQIYLRKHVTNFIAIGQVLLTVYQRTFWCGFFRFSVYIAEN